VSDDTANAPGARGRARLESTRGTSTRLSSGGPTVVALADPGARVAAPRSPARFNSKAKRKARALPARSRHPFR
jgi:hypothetical protein